MCYVYYACLNRWTCCCAWTEPGLYVMFMICLLWMHQQTCCTQKLLKLLKVYVVFTMDASTDGLVAHIHCYNFDFMLCYMYQTRCGGSSLIY